jgi:hypothetical protein
MEEARSMSLDLATATIKSGPEVFAARAKERLGHDGKITDLELQMTYRGIDWDHNGGLVIDEL